nr:unnamed protein product [Digitaria exilis]
MPRARAARTYYSAGHVLAAAGAVLAAVFLLAAGGGAVGDDDGAPARTPVHVGVILDLTTGLGKKSLLSLEMALEDLYAAHPSFATRVVLHVRDSDRDVVTAASAGFGMCSFPIP